jgi:hypothetical protein
MKCLIVLSVFVLAFTAHEMYESYRNLRGWINYLKGIK